MHIQRQLCYRHVHSFLIKLEHVFKYQFINLQNIFLKVLITDFLNIRGKEMRVSWRILQLATKRRAGVKHVPCSMGTFSNYL